MLFNVTQGCDERRQNMFALKVAIVEGHETYRQLRNES